MYPIDMNNSKSEKSLMPQINPIPIPIFGGVILQTPSNLWTAANKELKI